MIIMLFIHYLIYLHWKDSRLSRIDYKYTLSEQIIDKLELYNSYNINNPILFLSDIIYSYYEYCILRKITLLINRSKSISNDALLKENDPFTSSTLRKQDGIIYSIGSDLIDNYSSIIYDPTNGIISSGDIIIRKL